MITENQKQQLEELKRIFLEENAKLNLSALRNDDAVWIGNISDSLVFLDIWDSIAPSIPQPLAHTAMEANILDMGTGGGFPLLPLAICMPDCQFIGVDSTQKKLDAIQRMVDALGLTNIKLIAARAEELGRNASHRDAYDIVTARALAPLNVLLEYCAPLVKKGGYLVAWKSMKIETELQESLLARAELSCHLEKQYEYELPGDWGKRQLLVLHKTSNTPQKYPREVGLPKRKPLC